MMQAGDSGTVLAVRVIPRAKRNEIAGIMADGTIKIRLAAPPVDGKANLALARYLAEILDIPASRIEIISGHRGREKLVSVLGLDAETARARLIRMDT